MESKRFLFVSPDAAFIGDIARQVHKEGHDVKYYIEVESVKEIADEFVSKTDDLRSNVDWADVIIFDGIGNRWIEADGDRLLAWG